MKSLLASSGDSSPAREKSGLSLSSVRALMLREREEKSSTEFRHDERIQSLICSLFDAGTCTFQVIHDGFTSGKIIYSSNFLHILPHGSFTSIVISSRYAQREFF